MNFLNKIIILIIAFSIFTESTFAGDSETQQCITKTGTDINSEDVLKTLSEEKRLEFVYCLVDKNGGPSVENEDELKEDANQEEIDFASAEELNILTKQRELLNRENKDLSYFNKKSLIELRQGLDCGGKIRGDDADNIITCIKDPRKQAFKVWEKDSSSFGAINRTVNSYLTSIINGILFAFSEFVSNSAFGYTKFDELPELPYESVGSMFDTTTVYGMVNSFSLGLLALVIVYYFLKVGTSRGGDQYRIFLMKIFFVLVFIFFFPFLYKGLQLILNSFETALIDSTSKLSSLDPTNVLEGIRMDIFDLGGLTSVSLWTLIFFIPNVIALLIISILVFMRDVFLILLLNVFFLTAVGFLGGTLKEENIFEGNSISAKMSKMTTLAMFWVISVFLTVILTIFGFKFFTVLLASVPSIETSTISFVGALSNFSIEAFIYMILLILIVFFAKKSLLKTVFNAVSNFFMGIFFPGVNGVGGYQDLVDTTKDGYADMHMELENAKKNNPVFKHVTKSVQPAIDKTRDLVNKNEFIQNTAELLNETQQSVRNKFRPIKEKGKIITKVATLGYISDRDDLTKIARATTNSFIGVGKSNFTHQGNIDEEKQDLAREKERREKTLSELDENNVKDIKQIEKLKDRIGVIEKKEKELEEFEIMHTGDAREKLEFIDNKKIKEADEKVKEVSKELDEKQKKVEDNKKDLQKLDMSKDKDIIEVIEEKNSRLFEEISNLEKTQIVAKNLKEIREEQKENNLENMRNKNIFDDIKIPDILGAGKGKDDVDKKETENIKVKEEEKVEEIKSNNEIEIKAPMIEKKEITKNEPIKTEDILDKVSEGRVKFELKEEISDFISKYEDFKENYDEKVFASNPIFKELYQKEVKRAGGEDYIDLDILNTDIQDTITLLKKRK